MNILLIIFIVASTLESACAAPSGDPPVNEAWGDSVCGIQVGMHFMNNVVPAGGLSKVFVELRNCSTNVALVKPKTLPALTLQLTARGTRHDLAPHYQNPGSPGAMEVRPVFGPGERDVIYCLDFFVDPNVPEGDYDVGRFTNIFNVVTATSYKPGAFPLSNLWDDATNAFLVTSNSTCVLVSNCPKLRVVKAITAETTPPEILTNTPVDLHGLKPRQYRWPFGP